ncbi:MAG: patatin-like phospholipase family protein [Deltaproteobacteria bacterium]|nr:patatin-like phospholipase family protein [Deltaproteobacteria bacterium]
MNQNKPFRVLSLDGGGMRGTYTATYLSCLASAFAIRRGVSGLDVGASFDLIVGTSTGGIIACAIAAGVPLSKIVEFYRAHGSSIFPRRLPQSPGLELITDMFRRRAALACGSETLRAALTRHFGDMTLGDLYRDREIALAITAVELSQHRSWIFKTPHLRNTNHRDDHYRLVDICLATSAAPMYRSLAAVEHPDGGDAGYRVFADGGLWANNPVLVGLIDALEMTTREREIQVFCLGTCPRPAGEQVSKAVVHRDLNGWKFGGMAAALSIDAQEFAYDNIARMLVKHLDRQCQILRFPRDQIPAALMPYLDLDDTRPEAMDALINQARTDADMANSRCGDANSREGQLITRLFMDSPPYTSNS